MMKKKNLHKSDYLKSKGSSNEITDLSSKSAEEVIKEYYEAYNNADAEKMVNLIEFEDLKKVLKEHIYSQEAEMEFNSNVTEEEYKKSFKEMLKNSDSKMNIKNITKIENYDDYVRFFNDNNLALTFSEQQWKSGKLGFDKLTKKYNLYYMIDENVAGYAPHIFLNDKNEIAYDLISGMAYN